MQAHVLETHGTNPNSAHDVQLHLASQEVIALDLIPQAKGVLVHTLEHLIAFVRGGAAEDAEAITRVLEMRAIEKTELSHGARVANRLRPRHVVVVAGGQEQMTISGAASRISEPPHRIHGGYNRSSSNGGESRA